MVSITALEHVLSLRYGAIPLSMRLPRVGAGSTAATFESVVDAHQERVYNFCFRMMGDCEEAMELTQETFASVYENLESFRQEAQLSTWVLKISKNLCLNRLRYLARHGAGKLDPLDELSDEALHLSQEGPVQPDEAVELAKERARVQRAIEALEDGQRCLVVLRDIEGLSYQEVAEITELPEGTVKSRLHRARERLAMLLGGKGT